MRRQEASSGGPLKEGVLKGPEAAETRRPRASLRKRVRLWNAMVMGATLGALTVAAIHEERRQIVGSEAANAEMLLDHLARMPEFSGDVETVRSHLELMRPSLAASGDALMLTPLEGNGRVQVNPNASRIVATRSLALREGEFALQYLSDGDRLGTAFRRSVAMHLLYGLTALAALVAGTEWILRANLVVPLRSLSRQLDQMRDGGGWLPSLRNTDEELAGVARAVVDLGPALERQVGEWIEAERRAAVALAIGRIRSRLRERPDPDDAAAQDPIQIERDRLERALVGEERAAFGSHAPAAMGG